MVVQRFAADEENTMKTQKFGALFLLLVALCGNAVAELKLVEAKREVRDTALGQAYIGKDAAYWIQSSYSAGNASVSIQSFTARGTTGQRNVTLPAVPSIISPFYRSLQAKGVLLVYMDYFGKVHVTQIDDALTTVKKTAVLDQLSITNEIVLMQEKYAIGGIGNDDFPSLLFLDQNLSEQTKIHIPVKKKGEVASLLLDKGRFLAISNHSDATAYMHDLSLSGVVRSTTQLRGGGATGVSLGNRGFAISYRVGREVFIERLDSELKSLWTKKLHDVAGVARRGRIHDMQDAIAWVGANNDKLTIYRLDDNGNVIHTSIDKTSGYGAPTNGNYLSIVLGRDIHIRGQDRKNDGPVDGSSDSLYFIDREK